MPYTESIPEDFIELLISQEILLENQNDHYFQSHDA